MVIRNFALIIPLPFCTVVSHTYFLNQPIYFHLFLSFICDLLNVMFLRFIIVEACACSSAIQKLFGLMAPFMILKTSEDPKDLSFMWIISLDIKTD